MPSFLQFALMFMAGLLAGGGLVSLLIWYRRQKQKADYLKMEIELAGKAKELARLQTRFDDQETRLERQQQEMLDLHGRYQGLQADFKNLQERYQDHTAEIERLQKQATSQFESLASRVLHTNTEHFQNQSRDQLKVLLEPFREQLHKFEQKVADTYEKEARERFSLQKEIGNLLDLNQQLSDDARNLTQALKGDNKTQGNWGELVLSRVLESSGLREGEEYIVQGRDMGLKDGEGRRQQPDVIIKLPENRHLIIDAKVSLTAYEKLTARGDNGDYEALLGQHVESVWRHVQQLSDKHYAHIDALNSPDFVLMFMPIEPAFSLALQARPNLFSKAWERKIVLVSPSTLLATLRTVASVWKLEHQNQNAKEIARQGGLLYDKLASVLSDLDDLGSQIDRAQSGFSLVMKKIKDGKGNLLTRARRLSDLGVDHKKRIEG